MERYLSEYRTEINIFVSFLLIFTLFAHWGGVNDYARYDLSKAIVEDHSLEITPYHRNTIDKRFLGIEVEDVTNVSRENIDGEQDFLDYFQRFESSLLSPGGASGARVYTDKAPLSSFLGVPAYWLGDVLADFLDLEERDVWVDKGDIDKAVYLSTATALKQFLTVFFVSVLLGAGLLVMVYRYLEDALDDSRAAVYTTVIAGIATPLFFYSTIFQGVITAAFFGFASYYVLHRFQDYGGTWIYVAGILGGLAAATEYYAVLVPAGLGLFLLAGRAWENTVKYGLGVVIGLLPLFAYNVAVTGDPFTIVYSIGVRSELISWFVGGSSIGVLRNVGVILSDPVRTLNAAFRLLFFPTRGLFFYAPVLLLAVAGSYEIYRKNRRLLLVSPGIFLLFLLFQSSIANWYAGLSFGPRYTVVGLPFLMLPLGLGIKQVVEGERLPQYLVLFLVVFSAFHMFLGFNPHPDINKVPDDAYNERFNSLQPVQPGFYPGLVNAFQRNGPRSELLMSFLGREKGGDITYRDPYGPGSFYLGNAGDSLLTFRTSLLPLIIALMLLGVVWRREWFGKMSLVLAIVLVVVSFSAVDIHYAEGFKKGHTPDDRYIGERGEMLFIAERSDVPAFELGLNNVMDRSALKLNLNGESISPYQWDVNETIYLLDAPVREGINRLEMESTEGCETPATATNYSEDARCLSFRIINFSLVKRNRVPSPVFDQGWYGSGSSKKYLQDRGEIHLYSDQGEEFIRFGANRHWVHWVFDRGSSLRIGVNGEKNYSYRIGIPGTIYLPPEHIERGWNRLVFESSSGCVVPSAVSDLNDERCLSFSVQNLTLVDPEDAPEAVFISDWYPSREKGKWVANRSEILVRGEEGQNVSLTLESHRVLEDPRVRMLLNGGNEKTVSIEGGRENVTIAGLEEGWNSLIIESVNGCMVPSRVEDSEDDRCLSFRVRDIEVE